MREQHGPELAKLLRKRMATAHRATLRAIEDSILYGVGTTIDGEHIGLGRVFRDAN
jgi:hypothetical protein